MKCQIKVIKEVVDIFAKYQPKVGQVCDADYAPAMHSNRGDGHNRAEFCVINVFDKKIALRKGEYEIVRIYNG